MKRHELSITIELCSPFVFPSEKSAAAEFDIVALRSPEGVPIIPQDQIRGVLKHALRNVSLANDEIISDGDIDQMFGLGSSNARGQDAEGDTNFEPNRGVIFFSDLTAQGVHEESKATRIQVDSDTGAVKDGAIVSVELIARMGCNVSFHGTVQLLASDDDAKKWTQAIASAGSWVSAMGAMKTAGFGEVVTFSVERLKSYEMASSDSNISSTDQVCYDVDIDRPFLVDSDRAADNVFIGSEIFPGGVFKGALARKMQLLGSLQAHGTSLSELKFSHARVSNSAPVVPLSLCISEFGGVSQVHDALSEELPKGAIRFQSDWKYEDSLRVRGALGSGVVPELRSDTRTHVAIDFETGAATDKQLFVSTAVVPCGQKWKLEVDYSRIRDTVGKEYLRTLLEGGLWGVGQTGATLTFQNPQVVTSVPLQQYCAENEVAIMLQTDAIMCDTLSEDAFASYETYWRELLSDCKMTNFFASQRLAGGYLARRFRVGEEYNPSVITQAGSIFLLKGNLEGLQNLLDYGLPSPVINNEVTNWRNCPFQPENGYGQISCFVKRDLS